MTDQAPLTSKTIAWEFARYVNGRRMAEGIRITKAENDEQAFARAAQMAYSGDVLVLERSPPPPLTAETFYAAMDAAKRDAGPPPAQSSKEQVKETLGRFLKLLSEGCCRCDHDEAEGGLFDHCAACQREVTTIAYELFVSRRQPLATALEKFLKATDEPDARCITTPDGGCVSSDCMHTDTPTNRAQARLDAARIVDAMSAAEARSALIDAITRASVPPKETHPMLTVLTICDAYESGMGQGLANRTFDNPYDPVNDPHAYRAYGHGYDEGVKRRQPSTKDACPHEVTTLMPYADGNRYWRCDSCCQIVDPPAKKSACTCPPGLCCEKEGAAASDIRECRQAGETVAVRRRMQRCPHGVSELNRCNTCD